MPRRVVLAALVSLCLAPWSHAQEVRNMSVDELTADADAVVIGKVTATQSMWSDPRHLVTAITVSVGEVLKGDVASTISVVVPGGIAANRKFPVAMTYPGAPQFGDRENVLLFLSNDADALGTFAVTGFSEGKFSIVTDENGAQFVSHDRIDVVNVTTANGLPRGTRQLTPLSEVTSSVKAAAHKEGARQ
jgi:hypothetical protein